MKGIRRSSVVDGDCIREQPGHKAPKRVAGLYKPSIVLVFDTISFCVLGVPEYLVAVPPFRMCGILPKAGVTGK